MVNLLNKGWVGIFDSPGSARSTEELLHLGHLLHAKRKSEELKNAKMGGRKL